jgi:deoxyribodipyrimidine photolyase-related protein
MGKTLRLILGDQLNHAHSWFKQTNAQVVYCIMEMRQETDYVQHHIQKVAAFFTAMRQFAKELQQQGHNVIYLKINDKDNQQSLTANLKRLIQQHGFANFEYQLPDEYRLDKQLKDFCKTLSIPYATADTEHFLSARQDVQSLFENKKQVLMETFYRFMRTRYNILLEPNGKPLGGKWNYDAENRKKYSGKETIPNIPIFNNDVSDVLKEIQASGCKTFGHINAQKLIWPINRKQALQLLDAFLAEKLKYFGTYQDAMVTHQPFLFHSLLSFALNCKLLHPLEVVKKVEQHYYNNQQEISLAQAEGYIRQIIGWREYMRGIYWWKMPGYAKLNYFNHQAPLPAFYWNGKTRMKCMQQAINDSLNNAYAHHIQRLMITGNFALLAGVNPSEVDAWYLGIYIDAIEWVEITNTRGMSQFADGGIVGSKPYVSSANYIDKMSNYCKGCHYNKQLKYGQKACPFNSLYWHFYERNRPLLEHNNRIGMMYVLLDKMLSSEKQKILEQATYYLENMNEL